LWHGHRVFLLDGSSFSMPDTPALRRHFGQPSGQAEGCGFPVAHRMVRCDAFRGFLLETQALPLDSHDLAGVAALHAALAEGDLVVGERAFASYAYLALCQGRGVHGVFRAHHKQIVAFRPQRRLARKGETGRPHSRWLKRLGYHDQLVEYFKPKPSDRPAWMSAEAYARLPDSITVREIRYTIRERGRRTRVVTLVTTLLDAERYPAEDIARLYGLRWRVEELHKAVQTGCGIEQLQFKTEERLQPVIALLSVVGVFLLHLRDESRHPQRKQQPATSLVPRTWVVLLSTWRHHEPREDWSVEEFFYALARLGGHQNRKVDGLPGWLTIWRGRTKLQPMLAGAAAMEQARCAAN
jgi:hypothetical protein